ncbi:MAG: hypothetical protein IJW43_03985 [Clostridia bacterium]|nr:hypothetical protein [Clostridia bacterium]
MKYCVIDIGSNSVRLALIKEGKTEYKKVKITRLAQNLGEGRFLSCEAIDRTASAVKEFYDQGKIENPDKIFIFATAAVRLSKNGKEFTEKVYDLCGEKVDVVSGETEAMLGVLGALEGRVQGGLIDIGGASTEIATLNSKEVIGKSYPLGAGTMTEMLKKQTEEEIFSSVFGKELNIKEKNFFAIGGTATTVVAILLGLKEYDSKKVHGFNLTKEQVYKVKKQLENLTEVEISKIEGIQKGREGVIYAGVCILYKVYELLGIDKVVVSESDNLEGYLRYKLEKK